MPEETQAATHHQETCEAEEAKKSEADLQEQLEMERALREVEEFERRTAAQHELENNFWQERKECYIMIKLWEEDRRNKTLMLGKVLITMTENILARMLGSVQENEVLTSYLESMIKIQLEHS